MRKTFEVQRNRRCWTLWVILDQHFQLFPAEFRAFDMNTEIRRSTDNVGSCFIDDTLQMLVAVDWLLERDWELDLSRCDKAFLSVYPVTAEATA
jgi:hypothetical protein